MRVKCVASIAPILYRSELESVVETQNIPVREMREALLLGEWFVTGYKYGMNQNFLIKRSLSCIHLTGF